MRFFLFALPFVAAASVLAADDLLKPEQISVLNGFKIELVHQSEDGQGSWVAMCKDNKGRLIISPQNAKQPMLRFTISEGKAAKVEKINMPIGESMGMVYAFDSLYVSGRGGEKRDVLGLYRLQDTDGDDQYDKIELLKKFDGAGGEHGSHAVAVGPDNMLYYLHGNFVAVPKDISPNSPHKNYADDQLLPRGEDGNGFGAGMKPPGGFILRGDKDGKNWELFAAGMRNAYDFAFSNAGEMFTFDSDMEYDWSMPWYRPTRIYQLVSGGDYGFREGTAKWPIYYPDGLPPILDTAIGSPTGVTFGYGAKFPARYQKALYAMDWSYGRIFAIHLKPQGASYSATKETFVHGKPLSVTDMTVGEDGALYFTVGGRGRQSALYRVVYTGNQSTAAATSDNTGADARAVRKKLEAFHGRKDPAAVNFAWSHLGSNDRWIRYAARIAVESQDIEGWASRALEEENIETGLTALLALVRRANAEYQEPILSSLDRLAQKGLNEEQMVTAVRVLQLSMSRLGRPNDELSEAIVASVNPRFPSGRPHLDRELAQVLIYLHAPNIVERCLALVKASPVFEEQVYYIFHLRNLKTGWTRAQREEYFGWLNANAKRSEARHPAPLVNFFTEAGREYNDGASYPKFIANIKNNAMVALSDAERGELAAVIAGQKAAIPAATPAPRSFVKEWTTGEFLPLLDDLGKGGRNYKRGHDAFAAAQCLVCHRMRDEGGAIGPDLTAISQRFTRKDILESMTEPSKVVSEQFAATDFVLKSGDQVSGRVLEENDQRYVVLTNPLANTKTEIKKADVAKKQVATFSPMPAGLLNVLAKDEILDLIAYMEAAGRETHPLFQK